MELSSGWTFERFVAHLNSRVFFWPGTTAGPIAYGVRHFKRYVDEKPVLLRVLLVDLVAVNSATSPEFCRFNSGSPRWTRGVPSPRGPETFVRAGHARFRAAQVVEVTFPGRVVLPWNAEVGPSPQGPWRPLAHA